MKWKNCGVFVASISCLSAQSDQPPSTRVQADQLQQLLNDDKSGLKDLAKRLIGDDNTNRLFYFPTHDEPATPATWGFTYEDVNFTSTDGTRLHGWFLPAKGKANLKDRKGTVVFSHGNAGSLGHHIGFVLWLAEAGYNVFMYDYRGFGKSGGEVDRSGMIEDTKSAFKYVATRPDVDAKKLVSYGHSLGGAKSVAAIVEGKITSLKAIVIDGTFASYQGMARVIGGQFGADLITDEFSPKDFIGKVTGTPLLVIHGDRDEVVPFVQGKQLFDLANEPKTFFKVKEGSHGNSLARDNGAYRQRMLDWLEGVM